MITRVGKRLRVKRLGLANHKKKGKRGKRGIAGYKLLLQSFGKRVRGPLSLQKEGGGKEGRKSAAVEFILFSVRSQGRSQKRITLRRLSVRGGKKEKEGGSDF